MSDDNFDPITFNHWLAFKNRCLEGSPQDFQALFEAVMKRARPEFMQIKPYGKIGDRKCDGLLRGDGIVFQVYSPDQLKLADLRQKIDEDLGGAVGHWGDTMQKVGVRIQHPSRPSSRCASHPQ